MGDLKIPVYNGDSKIDPSRNFLHVPPFFMKGIRNYELKSREITLEALLKEIGLKIHHNFIPNFLWLDSRVA